MDNKILQDKREQENANLYSYYTALEERAEALLSEINSGIKENMHINAAKRELIKQNIENMERVKLHLSMLMAVLYGNYDNIVGSGNDENVRQARLNDEAFNKEMRKKYDIA